MQKLFKQAKEILCSGKPTALVTVVASSGSTPRGAGARMLVGERGRVAGTIGGGAVEHRSEQMALELLRTGQSKLEFFRLQKNQVLDLGMVCGGDVNVYFRILSPDRATLNLLDGIEEMYQRGEQSWLITEVTQEQTGVLAVYGTCSGLIGGEVPQEILPQLSNCPATVQVQGRTFYVEKLIQAGRVYIFGGGHVAQSLVPALAAVDFRCVVLEDREEFCRPELFPGVEETRMVDNERVLDSVTITEDDYVVIMTRGHKSDMTIQAQILQTKAHYIGVIGSRKKIDSVFAQLRERGYNEEDLARITTPIGLDIRAETPAEIAVSITAQLILHRANRNEQLRTQAQ